VTDHISEFDCIDCGTHVVHFGYRPANDQDICATCSWIRGLPSEADRKKLRAFLNLGGPNDGGEPQR